VSRPLVAASSERFSATTAYAVVVANMIGTGVFTSLGFQLVDIQSGFVLLTLWALGGLLALCGCWNAERAVSSGDERNADLDSAGRMVVGRERFASAKHAAERSGFSIGGC